MRKIGQFIDSGLLKIFDIDQMHKNSLFCSYWTLSHLIDKYEIFSEKQSRKTALIRKGLRPNLIVMMLYKCEVERQP